MRPSFAVAMAAAGRIHPGVFACQMTKGPEAGKKRVLRGGSWQDREKKISSFMRMSDDPATADICQGYDTYGFRCVKRVPAGK